MSFSSLIEKQGSRRTALVRLSGKMDVTDDLVFSTPNYIMTFSHPIASVTHGTTTLTKVTTVSGNNQYSHNESTGAFVMRVASLTAEVLIEYYTFFSSNEGVATYETPTDNTTSLREWQPRIVGNINIRNSIENIFQGVFSISQINVAIANGDNYMQQFFTDNNSFSNGDCDVWFVIDSIENIQKVYTGKIKSVSFGDRQINFTVFDSFSTLTEKCYMNFTAERCYIGLYKSIFLGVNLMQWYPSDFGKPFYYVFGKKSPNDFTYVDASPCGYSYLNNGLTAYDRTYSKGNAGLNTAYFRVNYIWWCFRGDGDLGKALTYSSINGPNTEATAKDGTRRYYNLTGHNFELGDSVKWTYSGTDYYGRVDYVGNFTYGGNSFNVAIRDQGTVPGAAMATAFTTPVTSLMGPTNMQGNFVVTLKRGSTYYPLTAGYHYDSRIDLSNDIDLNGYLGGIYWINLKSDFSTKIGFHPDPDEGDIFYVMFRRSDGSSNGHAAAAKAIIEASGMTTNAASFTQAQSDRNADVEFCIPNFNESDFRQSSEYLKDIAQSIPAYFSLNASNEVTYNVIDSVSPSDTDDDNVIIDGSLDVSHNYNDIYTEVSASNPNIINNVDLNGDTDPSSVASVSDGSATRLHGFKNSLILKHPLKTISSFISDILAFRCKPTTIYRFKTATKHLDVVIGQDITIENDQILDGSGTVDGKIISFNKSLEDVTIEAIKI